MRIAGASGCDVTSGRYNFVLHSVLQGFAMVGRLGGLYHEDWSNAFSVTLRGVASLCAAQDFGIPRPFGVKQISCEQWGLRMRRDIGKIQLCSRFCAPGICHGWPSRRFVLRGTGQMHFRLLCVELQVCVLLKTFGIPRPFGVKQISCEQFMCHF